MDGLGRWNQLLDSPTKSPLEDEKYPQKKSTEKKISLKGKMKSNPPLEN